LWNATLRRSGQRLGCFDLDIDGSKVWQYVQDGKIREVAEYCAKDVERTRQIYKRMNFME